MLNFSLSEKGLGLVSLSHFANDFAKKKCCSYYVLLTGQISLSDCLYFSKYWAICVLQLFVKQAVTSKNLKLTLIFLIEPFRYMTRKPRQKLKCLENEKSF